MRNAVADGGGADDERAVGDGFGDGGEFFGGDEDRSASDGGASLTEGGFVRLDDAHAEEAEVAHGASGRADVQRIARRDQNH